MTTAGWLPANIPNLLAVRWPPEQAACDVFVAEQQVEQAEVVLRQWGYLGEEWLKAGVVEAAQQFSDVSAVAGQAVDGARGEVVVPAYG